MKMQVTALPAARSGKQPDTEDVKTNNAKPDWIDPRELAVLPYELPILNVTGTVYGACRA